MILLASNHFLAADIIEVVGENHGGAEIRHEILQINHPAFPTVVRPSGVAALPVTRAAPARNVGPRAGDGGRPTNNIFTQFHNNNAS